MARSAVWLDMSCWRCDLPTDHIEIVPSLVYFCVICSQVLDLSDPQVKATWSSDVC